MNAIASFSLLTDQYLFDELALSIVFLVAKKILIEKIKNKDWKIEGHALEPRASIRHNKWFFLIQVTEFKKYKSWNLKD
jgi:hypothetical protein